MSIDISGIKLNKNSNGQLHRDDGPAIKCSNGNKLWCKEDKYHRLDGPSIEYPNKYKSWYILGKYLKEKEFNSWILRIQKCI